MSPRHAAFTLLAALLAAACQSGAQTDERELVTREMEPLMEPETPATAPSEPLDRSTPPAPGPSRPYELPGVEQRRLDNGLRVLLVDRPAFPTVSVRLSVRAGLDTQPDNIAVPILTARALRDGTTERSAEAIAAFIDGHGIGFSARAGTNQTILSADALSGNLNDVLSLLAELTREATFPDDRVASRVDELIAELEVSRAQPSFHRNRLARRVAFPGHPYAQLYATAEGAGAVTAETLREYYAAHYGPGRSTLVLVGDLPDGVEAVIESALGGWQVETPAYDPPAPVAPATCNVAHVVLRDDSAQTSILWLGPGPSMHDTGYANAVAANQILGGGASARLFLNLRQDKSYTYGAYSRLTELLGASWFSASSDVRLEVTGAALDEFILEFGRLASEELPADELADAKQYLSGVFPLQLETNAALASRISSLVDLGLGVEYLETYRERIGAVDPSAAQSASRSFVARDELALILVGEEDVVIPAASAHASRVFVYDLDGQLLREEPGELASTCE